MKYFPLTLFFIILWIFTSFCSNQKEFVMAQKKKADVSSGKDTYIVSAPIVAKRFVKKNGEVTDIKEYYLQRSIQDYFIKFCESDISREDLETHLANDQSFIKTVKLEVEFKKGLWDVCDETEEVQSRVGEYVVIKRIVS